MSMEEPVGETGELPEYAERVLDVADGIPPGRVMTYGDVAEWQGAASASAGGVSYCFSPS